MTHEDPSRITVSREALRADLAELKLDLIELLRNELEKKADQRLVESLDGRLTQLEREVVRRDGPVIRKLETYEGELDKLKAELGDRPELIRRFKAVEDSVREHRAGNFPQPFERRIRELVEEGIARETDAGWTRRERTFALIGVVILVLSFAFTVYISTSSSAPASEPTVIYEEAASER